MKYIDAIRESMEELGKQPNTMFLGYNVQHGNMAGGTLKNINKDQLFETPLAENLMMSLGVGMSLEGFYPVVYFERFDFILNALDSIINHLDKANDISKGEYDPKAYIRVAVGRKDNPFFSGLTHIQDFTEGIAKLVSFPVYTLDVNTNIKDIITKNYGKTFMTVEYQDLYDKTIENI